MPERASTLHTQLKSLAGTALVVVFFLLVFWPGFVVDLVPAVRAAFGNGTPGVIRLDERIPAKTSGWAGEFRSDDGRIVRERVTFKPEGRDYELGDTVPVLYNPTPLGWANPGEDVYPRTGNTAWGYPALVLAVWTAVLGWAAWRARGWLRRRGWWPERVPPTPPPCSCRRPDRCRHG